HYLTPQQRGIAPTLYAEMRAAAVALAGGIAIDQALDQAKAALNSAGFDRIDYFDLRRATDLAPSRHPASTDRLFAAVWLGQTRLIDNCQL
ncbi:MAG: pantoate--beta-alanine ligase, partial [Candidatus Puniceispirillum sp.]